MEDEIEEEEEEEEQANVPAALARWRRAVVESTSAAQLLLHAMQLQRAIAWEKSIMKVVRSWTLFQELPLFSTAPLAPIAATGSRNLGENSPQKCY